MSEQNVARLVDKLSTMRGAALKLGQFLSIQETKLLPPQIEQVLLRVQNSANYMPVWQMNKVMSQELGGSDWREQHFKEFEDIPFASASIGQVHSAVLRDDFPDPQMAGQKVAVKVQFPGVLESIDSDLSYLRWLVSASALLPKGLFLENTLRVLGRELKDECDYEREAEMGRRFGKILQDSSEFEVPKVVDSLCTGKVLTTEMIRGRPLSQASRYSQDTRDRIAQSILNLSLSELFRYRLMQTDPNWSNFLYNERTGKIQLIDFGATREYSKEFMDNWLQMLQAAIAGDYEECLTWSRKVGYLTGEESAGMERAHVESMIALGEPFRVEAPNPGIAIPLKPPPPGPEECCMSGCAHCAYDIYAEDLEDFHSRLSTVRTQLTQLSPPVTREEWREDLLGDYPSSAGRSSGDSSAGAASSAEESEEDMRERAQREVDRVIGDLDPTMRAFLEMERKLKKQEREKAKQA
ncbi:hypothetical protein NDA16_004206 [Ustilago loliicola]|nr:hypothetical protein NDA16_004206 [Ustilago loliicola]